MRFSIRNDMLFIPVFWDKSVLLFRSSTKILLGFVAS